MKLLEKFNSSAIEYLEHTPRWPLPLEMIASEKLWVCKFPKIDYPCKIMMRIIIGYKIKNVNRVLFRNFGGYTCISKDTLVQEKDNLPKFWKKNIKKFEEMARKSFEKEKLKSKYLHKIYPSDFEKKDYDPLDGRNEEPISEVEIPCENIYLVKDL